jgi:aerotolerance regulator-like protein
MNFTLANTWGLWALLGLPAVIAIHFLQRRNRRVPATTLFLLQQMKRESRTGSRFERLRTSIPFWLQLLMVLVLTWLLVQPRWLKQDAVQRIAIVMDTSASMQAFRAPALQAADEVLGLLEGPLARAELTLLSSDSEAPSLYHGTMPSELRQALAQWEPLLGVHDFTPALRVARGLVGPQGIVVLVTDHPLPVPPLFAAQVISVGQETDNVGWAGVTVEEKDGQWIWHALVKNYSRSVQERQWRALAGGAESPWKPMKLGPDETQTLSGPFPAGDVHQIALHLSDDALKLDNDLPLVRPQPKTLALCPLEGKAGVLAELFSRYAHLRIVAVPGESDLVAAVMTPSFALPEQRHGCFFQAPADAAAPYLKGSIVAEPHALVEGLNWQGLLVRESKAVPRQSQDRVLLWQGERPLIVLRLMPAGGRQLICHFDLETSNARKLPAFAVLLHRFLETLRADKLAPEAANFDVRQHLAVAHRQDAEAAPLQLGEQEIPLAQARLLRAPARPGHFTVHQGETLLLTAAAHFADTREADLTQAKPFNELAQIKAVEIETLHEADPNWRLWLILLLLLLLGSWWFTHSKREAQEVASA